MAYIKLEELQKIPIRIDHYDKENGNEDFVLGIETAIEYAEHLPTADVVEVVRCKDCEHWNGIGFAENAGWCEKKDIGTLYNDFCSFGERKENE